MYVFTIGAFHTLPSTVVHFQIHALFGRFAPFYCLTTINASLYPGSFTGTCRCFLLKPFIFLFMLQFGYHFFCTHLLHTVQYFFAPPLRYRWLPFLFPSYPACVPEPLVQLYYISPYILCNAVLISLLFTGCFCHYFPISRSMSFQTIIHNAQITFFANHSDFIIFVFVTFKFASTGSVFQPIPFCSNAS